MKTKLEKLKKDQIKYNVRWLLNGGELTFYRCNHCLEKIETKRPFKKDLGSKGYWDSATVCIECGGINVVKIWPTGRTISSYGISKQKGGG